MLRSSLTCGIAELRPPPPLQERSEADDCSAPSTSIYRKAGEKEDVMDKIVPHLWFDTEAKEAAQAYTSLFDNSSVVSVSTLRDTPSGDCDVVWFELAGQSFQAISAGPLFKFNPSVSFRVDCAQREEVDALWDRLSEGGEALMPLDTYPWSERYGWLQDRYGLSWQLMYAGDREFTKKIIPTLMFVGDVCGKAEEAITFYSSLFENSEVGDINRYGKGEEPEKEGTVRFASFALEGQQFAAMDSAREHAFAFNEAISLMILCDSQEEVDRYWERLSAVPEAEQCGWLKDRYGLSWQVVPRALDKMMEDADEETLARITQAFLPMKKLDLAKLEEAYART
jgi:predicted 3-demethylubiquinone-9 3-methyltransferase (glyoxalase superfamily)